MKAHRKNTCLQGIGLHLQNLLTILNSIVRSIMKISEKKLCVHLENYTPALPMTITKSSDI